MLRNARMKSPLRTLAALAALAGAAVAVILGGRTVAARRAFDRELAVARGDPTPEAHVEAALRVPRTTALLGRLADALRSEAPCERTFAATVVELWDARPRADGFLPRPEHHPESIDELRPLLPAIAEA